MQRQKAERGRDNNVFEGGDSNLGQGKDWATLTDGAKDTGANAGGNGSLVDNIETTLTHGAKNPAGNVGANDRSVKGVDEIVDKMEMTLTDDCAMSMSGNKGAEEGPVNNMDEIGLIFKFEDIETKVCLKEFGSYMKFNNKCLHRKYKRGSVKTYLSAQLFSALMRKRRTVQNNVAEFEEGTLKEDNLSVLKSISEAVQRGWKEKYMKKKFNAPKTFQSCKVNQEKTRKINQEYFKDIDLVEVTQLIKIFESIYSDIWSAEVWFLKKKEMGDGFEDFHYDYGSSNGGINAISSLIKVNLGVCHLEDEEEKDEKEAGNAEAGNAGKENDNNENGQVEDSNEAMNERAHRYLPEPPMEVEGMEETTNEGYIILLGKDIEEEDKGEDEEAEASNNESVKVESVVFAASNSPNQPERTMLAKEFQFLNWELTPEEENNINLAKNELQNIKNGKCLTSGDICKYFDYLEGQDKQMCKNFPGRKPLLFHSTNFVTFNSDGIRKYLKKNQILKIDISKTRNIFIPIHKGNHFTCVVIFLDKKQISYYDSLLATNRTRTGCAYKKELQEKILGVVMQYLQDEFKKSGYNWIDENNWSLKTNCNVP